MHELMLQCFEEIETKYPSWYQMLLPNFKKTMKIMREYLRTSIFVTKKEK